MHLASCVALLAVDEASIHLNAGKVKLKMKKKMKLFQVLQLAAAGARDYTFLGYTFFPLSLHHQKCINSKIV